MARNDELPKQVSARCIKVIIEILYEYKSKLGQAQVCRLLHVYINSSNTYSIKELSIYKLNALI